MDAERGFFNYSRNHDVGFPAAQLKKKLPAMQETRAPSLGREEPLDKEMANHSSTLAWEIPQTRGAWQATVHGGNGNPLQC